eukprot:CAMPEP_0182437802 /NCGR_PEP_ID=MMETSP1167-20130531/85293_1 /TAXON_ID=2988 /ORGANISM="Mallomonas Sp, Strain CCMP3275" /LENGTH=569 /DNA_ID=CAMNT_0024630851 /DNA_START=98 /DNA_END=1807 /DNA_ORIENTATION=+
MEEQEKGKRTIGKKSKDGKRSKVPKKDKVTKAPSGKKGKKTKGPKKGKKSKAPMKKKKDSKKKKDKKKGADTDDSSDVSLLIEGEDVTCTPFETDAAILSIRQSYQSLLSLPDLSSVGDPVCEVVANVLVESARVLAAIAITTVRLTCSVINTVVDESTLTTMISTFLPTLSTNLDENGADGASTVSGLSVQSGSVVGENQPSAAPTVPPVPTPSPVSSLPTVMPTVSPTRVPTVSPTVSPTTVPTVSPTLVPTPANIVETVFSGPISGGFDFDSLGDLYVLTASTTITKQLSGGTQSIYAGGGSGPIPGAASGAQFSQVYYTSVDSGGNLYFASNNAHVVYKVDTSAQISVLIGDGTPSTGGDGGNGPDAQVNGPIDVYAHPVTNEIYLSEQSGRVIRKLGTDNIMSTIAGTGSGSLCNDGDNALSCHLPGTLFGLTMNSAGDVYFVYSSSIGKILAAGTFQKVAGGGGSSGDGDGTSIALSGPRGMAGSWITGDVYFAEVAANKVRKLDPSGYLTTVAGTGSSGTYTQGLAPLATDIESPYGLKLINGDTYVAISAGGPSAVLKFPV